MDSIQRVMRVIEGHLPDRPPVSFWHHFPADQIAGQAAVAAHVRHLETYELDFLKVMNDNPYPHPILIDGIKDLASLRDLSLTEVAFTRQLDLISDLRKTLRGRVLMATTVFNAWSVLRHLISPPKEHKPPNMSSEDEPSRRIKAFYEEDPDAVADALRQIAANLSRFADKCIDAGADGIYLSVREDWVDAPGGTGRLYSELVTPTDLRILEGASAGRFNILHVCGNAVHFDRLASYPVQVVSWADRSAGPAIADAKSWLKPAICAGVDNLHTLPRGTPVDCEREVDDALRQAGDRPMIVATGCTYDPDTVPSENLHAVSRAAREHRYH